MSLASLAECMVEPVERFVYLIPIWLNVNLRILPRPGDTHRPASQPSSQLAAMTTMFASVATWRDLEPAKGNLARQ